jgi:hypothetical protein
MGLPVFESTNTDNGYTFTYVRSVTGDSGLSYEAQYSTTLSSWLNVTSYDGALQSTTITPIDADYEFVTLEFDLSDSAIFFRVEVTVD